MLFEKKGKRNTQETTQIAIKRAKDLGIKHLVVASCSGETTKEFLESGLNIVCVTHQVGFNNPGEDEMSEETRLSLQKEGIRVLTTTHLLAGVDRALRFKFQGIYPAEIIAGTLRMFGQGVKVCVEVSVMALDAGLIPYGEEIIAVGGTGVGADTAMILTPAHSAYIFDTNIKEILCMPRGH
ncbi:MAG: pyruvate kinase alpha/beta domain-containing protein [Dehalobacterium sp.]